MAKNKEKRIAEMALQSSERECVGVSVYAQCTLDARYTLGKSGHVQRNCEEGVVSATWIERKRLKLFYATGLEHNKFTKKKINNDELKIN